MEPEGSIERNKKLRLAARLFKEFYASCFWHMKPDLEITELMIPLIVKGLRHNGGKRGMLAAEELLNQESG